MIPLQARIGGTSAAPIKVEGFWSIINQGLALLPRGILILGFFLLAVLAFRAFKNWKQLTIVELSAIVMAFALVGR